MMLGEEAAVEQRELLSRSASVTRITAVVSRRPGADKTARQERRRGDREHVLHEQVTPLEVRLQTDPSRSEVHAAAAAVTRDVEAPLTVSNEDFLLPITILEPCLMDRRRSTEAIIDQGDVFQNAGRRVPRERIPR